MLDAILKDLARTAARRNVSAGMLCQHFSQQKSTLHCAGRGRHGRNSSWQSAAHDIRHLRVNSGLLFTSSWLLSSPRPLAGEPLRDVPGTSESADKLPCPKTHHTSDREKSMENSSSAGFSTDAQSEYASRLTTTERAKRFLKMVTRDIRMIGIFLNIRKAFWNYERRQETVGSLLHKTTLQYPDKPAVIAVPSGHVATFTQLEKYANQVANLFQHRFAGQLTSANRVVALFGNSSVEYVGIWVGLSKLNITVALVNNNLVSESLVNSLLAASPRAIVVDTALRIQFETARHRFPDTDVLYYTTTDLKNQTRNKTGAQRGLTHTEDLNALLKSCTTNEPTVSFQTAEAADSVSSFTEAKGDDKTSSLERVLFYIYTSGTTGPPKSCIISQRRFLGFAKIVQQITGMKPRDVIYCPLPLYHTAGGIATLGQALLVGSTVVVRNKFSASSYWQDIVQYKCTAAQYIGEMCRFLQAQPVSILERQHQLRVIFGQGLRPTTWKAFQERFGVPKIVEMYGSTEGNTGLANMHDRTGAVGYLSPMLHAFHPQAIVKVDRESGEVMRDKNGFCQKVSAGGEGELIGQVSWDPLKKFDGYTDKSASRSKMLQGVFKQGDVYFRSGDIMMLDEEGFVYFVDRLGDAYRWKGENVSSTEVESIVSSLCNHAHVAAYGVEIPGAEGKAGMACVSLHATDGSGDKPSDSAEKSRLGLAMESLADRLLEHLPSYALPVFIRLTATESLQLTGTFRIQKEALKNQGYDPGKCGSDRLFYLISVKGSRSKAEADWKARKNYSYVPLTQPAYQSILELRTRF